MKAILQQVKIADVKSYHIHLSLIFRLKSDEEYFLNQIFLYLSQYNLPQIQIIRLL